MKALIDSETKDVIGVGYINFNEGYDLNGRDIVDVTSMPDDFAYCFRLINGEFVRKSQEEINAIVLSQNSTKEAYEAKFSVESFQEALFGALMQGQFSSPTIRSEFAQVVAFVTGTKQFAMLKQYLGWLISQSVITEADYSVVSGILALQNIDLESY